MASGAGWAWLRDAAAVTHVTGPRGPRGPVTVIVDAVPVLAAGQRVELDLDAARPWRTPEPPPPASPERIAAACDAVRPHMWNDPRALSLGTRPVADVAGELAGRGPGLTPAGDDVLAGYLLARRAIDPDGARVEAARILTVARRATGEPSRSLLRAAVHGQAFEPAAAMLAALLRGDGPAIAPAVRRLAALGSTTGRAMLTGLVRGLLSPPD